MKGKIDSKPYVYFGTSYPEGEVWGNFVFCAKV